MTIEYTYTTVAYIVYDCVFEDRHFKHGHTLSEYISFAKSAMLSHDFATADIIDRGTGEILAQLSL